MKVDGLLNNTIAFAIYAPDTFEDNKTVRKITEDFEGFLAQKEKGNWENIEQLNFVIKVNHKGLSSKVLNCISEFNKKFPTEVYTLDDLRNLQKNTLSLSIKNDNNLLKKLKSDTTLIIEEIIKVDLSAEALSFCILDQITILKEYWLYKKNYIFENKQYENLKKAIFQELIAFENCIEPQYFHELPNASFFRNDEDIEVIYETLLPRISKIKENLKILLDKLWDIK